MSNDPLANRRFKLDGHTPVPCESFQEWIEWYQYADCQVALTGNSDIWVLTVFLGLNHRFLEEGPPILFETLVLGGKHDNEGTRSCTWEEAEFVHKTYCAIVFPQLAKENKDGKMQIPNINIPIDFINYLITIPPDIRKKALVEKLERPPKLEKLQQIVGGYIEHVPFWTTYNNHPCIAFCNEYGKLNGMPLNQVATSLWLSAIQQPNYPDHLVGQIALIVGTQEFIRWVMNGDDDE